MHISAKMQLRDLLSELQEADDANQWAETQVKIASLYHEGKGGAEEDDIQAKVHLDLALQQNRTHPGALALLDQLELPATDSTFTPRDEERILKKDIKALKAELDKSLYYEPDNGAKRGFVQMALGKKYLELNSDLGDGLAVDQFRLAAAQGNAEASFQLANLHLDNIVTDTRLAGHHTKLAFGYFENAANLDHPEALLQAANRLEEGVGTEKNLERAFNYYQRAVELDKPLAKHRLGLLYINSEGIPALDELSEQARARVALKHFEQAADDIPDAAFNAATLHQKALLSCKTTNKTLMEEVVQLFKTAEAGYLNTLAEEEILDEETDLTTSNLRETHYQLGMTYLSQKRPDIAEAFLKKAADTGHTQAQVELGYLYFEKNQFDEAFYYYKSAAEGEDPHEFAQCNLAHFYNDPEGRFGVTERDEKEATRLWEAAAEKGLDAAQFSLAITLQQSDPVRALALLGEAYGAGYQQAKPFIDQIKADLKERLTEKDQESPLFRSPPVQMLSPYHSAQQNTQPTPTLLRSPSIPRTPTRPNKQKRRTRLTPGTPSRLAPSDSPVSPSITPLRLLFEKKIPPKKARRDAQTQTVRPLLPEPKTTHLIKQKSIPVFLTDLYARDKKRVTSKFFRRAPYKFALKPSRRFPRLPNELAITHLRRIHKAVRQDADELWSKAHRTNLFRKKHSSYLAGYLKKDPINSNDSLNPPDYLIFNLMLSSIDQDRFELSRHELPFIPYRPKKQGPLEESFKKIFLEEFSFTQRQGQSLDEKMVILYHFLLYHAAWLIVALQEPHCMPFRLKLALTENFSAQFPLENYFLLAYEKLHNGNYEEIPSPMELGVSFEVEMFLLGLHGLKTDIRSLREMFTDQQKSSRGELKCLLG